MKIGERIKKRRTEMGLSVDRLADILGKNRATIYRYENNEIENFPTTVLEPLAKALQTTPAHLMGWDDPAENNMAGDDSETKQSEPNIPNISEEEWALINRYRALSPVLQKTVLSLLTTVEEMSKTQEEQSAGEVS